MGETTNAHKVETSPEITGPWLGEMMADGNGTPTLGELHRNIADLKTQVFNLDAKVDRYASVGVEAKLGEIVRRLDAMERVQMTGADKRSNAAWQGLFLVLGVIGSMAAGVVIALLVGGA